MTLATAVEVTALRQALDQNVTVWQKVSDLSTGARRLALKKFSPLMRESVLKRLELIEAELGYGDAPAIERLLIEQVGTCWLQLHLAEAINSTLALEEAGISQSEFLEKRLTGAQGRYLKAIETLARVRRLLRPGVVQVNIGAQQLNVAGGGGD